MNEGTESPVTHQQIILLEQRMQLPDLRLFVREQREGDHLNDHAAEGIEQAQSLWNGEPTSGLLAAGLSEGLLQRRGVGGDGAGTIDQDRAMPVP